MAEPTGGDTQRPGIGVEVSDGIAVVTIDRPHVRNAIDPTTARELHEAVAAIEFDPGVRAAVLTGSGNVFCAGSDLRAKALGAGPAVTEWGFGGFVKSPRLTPFVAAVNGAARGGGFELALACELVIAACHASFGLPEVHRGLVAGGGGLVRLPARVPSAVACEIVLTGRPIDAVQAERWGLVNRVVDADRLLETALEVAAACASGAPLAVRESMAVVREVERSLDPALWSRAEQASRTVAQSQDGREGPRAFAEGRRPQWVGH